jgi:hypothetical protein
VAGWMRRKIKALVKKNPEALKKMGCNELELKPTR